VIGADIGFPEEGEPLSSVVICHEVPRKRTNNAFNVRIALRRTRMLGNGCEEAFLIDGYLLQIPVDKEEIRGRLNVPEHDLPDFEMAPPHVLNGMTSPLLLHLNLTGALLTHRGKAHAVGAQRSVTRLYAGISACPAERLHALIPPSRRKSRGR
jgi:hypothetical protein